MAPRSRWGVCSAHVYGWGSVCMLRHVERLQGKVPRCQKAKCPGYLPMQFVWLVRVMTDVAGLWIAEALAGVLERQFWFCSKNRVCWSRQPSFLFFYIVGHPLAGWECLTQICVVFLFVDADYCLPVGVLGLEKDKGFLEQELWVNLATSAQPCVGV